MQDKIYYICKYTPLEIIEGFNIKPVQLKPASVHQDCAGSCIHPNLCAYGKALMEEVLAGGVTKLFLVDCCDVIRRMYDMLHAKKKMDYLYFMHLPHKNGVWAKKAFKKELLRCRDALEDYTGRDFDEEKACQAWQEGIKQQGEMDGTGEYLLLTGAHGGAGLAKKIEESTGFPVKDETCAGMRELQGATSGDFWENYAQALLEQKNPCMRMQFQDETPKDALGTICHTMKFCDYYGFKYRTLREEPGALLKIETDATLESAGQLETRLEAFREVLKPKLKREKGPSQKTYVCGIDSGSSSTNAVILDEKKNMVASYILPTGAGVGQSAEQVLEEVLKQAGIQKTDLARIVTTGYGRKNLVKEGSAITEISCHAKGAHQLFPEARTVIDIGGQDSKVIVLTGKGRVERFVMNDKCAAGTGRFLETMAKVLRMSLDAMSAIEFSPKRAVTISSMCTVFAESEVVSLIADNTQVNDIVGGLDLSVATKTVSLVRRAKGEGPYIMTGGVAKNRGVVRAIENQLGENIIVPEEAQLCGALGAALFALESIE